MSRGTSKTDIFKLLLDVVKKLEDAALGEYGYVDPTYRDILNRCYQAIHELS